MTISDIAAGDSIQRHRWALLPASGRTGGRRNSKAKERKSGCPRSLPKHERTIAGRVYDAGEVPGRKQPAAETRTAAIPPALTTMPPTCKATQGPGWYGDKCRQWKNHFERRPGPKPPPPAVPRQRSQSRRGAPFPPTVLNRGLFE